MPYKVNIMTFLEPYIIDISNAIKKYFVNLCWDLKKKKKKPFINQEGERPVQSGPFYQSEVKQTLTESPEYLN